GRTVSRAVSRPGPEAVEQRVEHLDLAGWRDPPGVEHALRAHAVDEHDQLVRGEIEVDAAGQLTAVAGLGQMPAQPGAEPVELGVLQVPELRRAQRPAPEADLDLRLQVSPLVEGQRLEHDDPQRVEAGEPRAPGAHPPPPPPPRPP